MAFIDTTTTKPPRPPRSARQRWPRKPSDPNAPPSLGDVGQPTTPKPEVEQPAPAPPQQNGSGPQPVTVNPLPMPGQPRTSRPAIATPQLSDVTVAQPDILGTVQGVLQPELTTDITQDPRYLSAMSQLKQKQDAEKLQRKNDLIRLGIVADDGSNFSNFDTLGQNQTIEQQNLLSVIQGLRQQDTANALALGGQQASIGQNNVQNRLQAVGQEADISLKQQAQDLATQIQTGQLSIAQANQKMQEAGQAGGQFVRDPATGSIVWQPTQAASEFATVQTGVTPTGQSTLAKVGQEAGIEATRAGLTGVAPLYNPDGTPAIDPDTGQQRTGTTLDAQKLGLSQAQVFGKAGPIAAGTMTEEAQQNRAHNALTQQGLTINDSNLKAQVEIQQARDAGTAYDPSTGKWVTSVEARTAASRISYESGMLAEQSNARIKQNQLDFATLTGLVRDPLTDQNVKTVAQKELDQRTTIENAQQKLQRDIAEADRIGQMGGKDTVQYKQAMQAISESQAKVDQAWTDLTGSVPGDTSPLAGTKSVEQQTLELAKTNAALQRAIDQGKATGKFVDPITNKDQVTLEAEISRGQLQVEKDANEASRRANIYQMTGRAPLIDGNGEYAGMMDTLENRIKTGELALSQANTYGESILINPRTGAVQYTIDTKGNPVPVTQSSINADIAKRGMTDQENRTALAQQEQYGGFTDTKTGKFMPTQAASQWTDQQKQNYLSLGIQARESDAKIQQDWSSISGQVATRPGTYAYSDFKAAFEDSEAGKGFDPALDFNGDGKVDYDDYFKGSDEGKILPDDQAKIPTMAQKSLDAQVQQAAWSWGLDNQAFQQSVKEFATTTLQKNSEFLTKQTGYVYDPTTGNAISQVQDTPYGPPRVVTGADINRAIGGIYPKLMNGPVQSSDPAYNTILDVNSDGKIDMDDINKLPTVLTSVDSQARTAAGLTDPKTYLSGIYGNLSKGGTANYAQGANVFFSIQPYKTETRKLTSTEQQQVNTQNAQWQQGFNEDVNKWIEQLDATYYGVQKASDGTKQAMIGNIVGSIISAGATVIGAKKFGVKA